MPGESKTSPRRIGAAFRQKQALQLRIVGATFEQIAEQLGYSSRAGAYLAVMAALRKVPEPEVETLRKLNIERLNKARLATWTAFGKDKVDKAVSLELGIQDREARYLGLDAPVKHEVAIDIEPQIRALAEALGLDYNTVLEALKKVGT